tara:strand:+ start:1196 stop:1639 length:444 start_codon:yes stop_codon:yes gene_type:complete
METLKIEIGKVSDHLYSLMTQTKARKIRAGFIKKDGSYREGTFDLKDRKTWKQTDGTMYQRKGKKRTTNPDEYILAHDLTKKQPRNISVSRLKWFSVGKKVYQIDRLELDNDVNVVFFNPVKFNHLDSLMEYYRKLNNTGENNDKSS